MESPQPYEEPFTGWADGHRVRMTILERGSVTKLPCIQDSDKRHDYFNLIDPHQLIDCVEWMNANDAIHIDIAFTVLNKLHEGVQEGMGWPIGQWEPRPPLSS